MRNFDELERFVDARIRVLQECRARIVEMQREVRAIVDMAGIDPPKALTEPAPVKRRRGRSSLGNVSMRLASIQALRQKGPMRFADLAIEAKNQGAKSNSDFKKILYQALRKARTVKNPLIGFDRSSGMYWYISPDDEQ